MSTTIVDKASDVKKNASATLQHSSEKLGESLDGVKLQLLSYASQIQEYLTKQEANIDGYKFSIERQGEGLTIDIAFKATIHPRASK